MKAKIVPFNEERGHAVRNVLFVVEYVAPLPLHAFAEFQPGSALHSALKKVLPKFGEQQQLIVNFPGDSNFINQSFPQPGLLNGVTFEKIKPDGEAELGLNIQGNNLFIVCGDYTRWLDVVARVNSVIGIISAWLNQYVVISNFTLQYIDEFKVSFDDNIFRPLTDLFVTDAPYLVTNFKNLQQEFHSHHGFFSDPDFEIAGRLLTNVNVNVSAVKNYQNVQIQTTHKYQSFAHLKLVEQTGELTQLMSRAYEYLHQENKKVLGSMLTDEVKNLISFYTRNAED
jgi:uncharacterized protein (TIGR04255 family)